MGKDKNVYMVDENDPEMQHASQRAQSTFKYFWRELSWEYRRIVPALEISCVKAAFFDHSGETDTECEHMWVNEISFDGEYIRGKLINSPNWIRSVKEGDPVKITLAEVGDWMFAVNKQVYGAFTVNLMRARMSVAERQHHDDAWGLNFGDPNTELLDFREQKSAGILGKLFNKTEPDVALDDESVPVEHPMSMSMAESLREQLSESQDLLASADHAGWTLFHHEALAGNLSPIKVLLEFGVDPKIQTHDGRSALDLARILGWQHVIDELSKH